MILAVVAGTLSSVLLVDQQGFLPSLMFQSPLIGATPYATPLADSFSTPSLFESPLPTPDQASSIASIQFTDNMVELTHRARVDIPFFGLTWNPTGTGIIYAESTDAVLLDDVHKGFTPLTSLWYQDLLTGNRTLVAPNGRFPRWSPSGNQVLFILWLGANQSHLVLADISTGKTSNLVENGVYADWLSNDEIIVVGIDGEIARLNLYSRYEPFGADLVASTSGPNSIVVSPDKQWLAIVNEAKLQVFSFASNKMSTITAEDFTDIVGGLAWSPQSNRLAYVNNKSIHIADLSEQITDRALGVEEQIGFPSNLSWSPDGIFLLYQGFDGIWVIDVESGARKLLYSNTQDQRAVVSSPSWAPSGNNVILEKNGNVYMAAIVYDENQ